MRLYLGGFLSFYSPAKKEIIEVPVKGRIPLRVLLDSLGIPVSNIYLSVVNGEQVAVEEVIVMESDEVHLYPPMDGG